MPAVFNRFHTWLVASVALVCSFSFLDSALAEWAVRTHGAMSVETLAPFKDPIDVTDQLPPAVKALIKELTTRMAGEEADGIIVSMAVITYKDEAAITIDGAVSGAVTNAAAALGDKAPKYTVEKFKVNGLEIRRVFYQDPKGETFIRSQIVRSGQTIYQVQAITTKDKVKDGDRVLDSMVVEEKK